jgi:hypothetical protein
MGQRHHLMMRNDLFATDDSTHSFPTPKIQIHKLTLDTGAQVSTLDSIEVS